MEIKSLLEALDANTQSFQELISCFTELAFLQKPGETAWSAAQIADHIVLLEQLVNKVYASEPREADRAGDQKVKVLYDALLRTDNRFNAPDVVLPSPAGRSQAESLHAFAEQRAAIRNHIVKSDPSLLYPALKHPYLGEMSGCEWGWFSVAHTERHIRQMRALLQNK